MLCSHHRLGSFRFRAPSSDFVPERIGRLGHPLVCLSVGSGLDGRTAPVTPCRAAAEMSMFGRRARSAVSSSNVKAALAPVML